MFILKQNKPVIEPKMLNVPEFKKIWDRDRSSNKKQAVKELAFVYFMADYKSEYNAYGLDKENMIAHDIMGDPKFKADNSIILAIAKYEEMQKTVSMRYLQSAESALNSLIKYYEQETTNIKTLQPDKITKALKETEAIMEKLEKWSKKVHAEEESMQIRGGGKVGIFEDEDKATWIPKKGR